MSTPLVRVLALLATACLAGCPRERPGAAKEIPTQRIPPAMPVEPNAPAPAAAGPLLGPDAGTGSAAPAAGAAPSSPTPPRRR